MHVTLLVYIGDDDSPSEPDVQFIPDTPSLASVGGDPLTASMTLLKDGLDTGTTVAQFEVCLSERFGSMNYGLCCNIGTSVPFSLCKY